MKKQLIYIIKKATDGEAERFSQLLVQYNYQCKIINDYEALSIEITIQKPDLLLVLTNKDDMLKIQEVIKSRYKIAILYVVNDYFVDLETICKNEWVDYVRKDISDEELVMRIKKQLSLLAMHKDLKEKTMQFEVLLNNTPYMAWFKDKDSNYIMVNNDFMEHSGKTLEQIYGQGDHYVWDGKIGEKCREYDLLVMNERKKVVFDQTIPGKKGYRQFNVYKAPVINEDEDVIGTVGIARDITDLRNKDTKFQILMEHIPFATWVLDQDGICLDVNSKLASHYNLTPEQIIGKKIDILFSGKKLMEMEAEDKKVMESKEHLTYESVDILNGEEYIFEVHKNPIVDISGEVIGIVGLAKDITTFKKAEQEIRKHAYTDSLTQLENRRGLYQFLEDKIGKTEIHILFIDLDDFKQVNDICGHHFGDEVLKDIAIRLKCVCQDGFIARIGGDEFIVVFEGLYPKKQLENLAKQIIRAVEQLIEENEYKYHISASIGIVSCGLGDTNIDQLLIKGDMALYRAKERGKNQFVFYTKGLENERLLRINIERDLHYAIEKKQIKLHYQPLYFKNGNLKGFESLFRWENEKYKDVSVGKIIDVMEKSALMNEIGNEIMRQAFSFAKQINQHRDKKDFLVVTINISAVQIMKDTFVEGIKRIIEEVGVCPSCIGIEITETILLEDIEQGIEKLHALESLGMTILLDDFGTGYSSFSYLAHLPLSIIKIDRSFVSGMDKSKEYNRFIKLIIDAAHSVEMVVVAEGVETEKQLQMLKKMQVDCIQGYYYSKPLSATDAMLLITEEK
ncbi:MAG: EAL domain-containing protein [Bacillaceae bacterium]